MRLVFRRQFHRRGFAVWIVRDDGHQFQVGKPTSIAFEDAESGAFALPEPTFEITDREMETLISSVKEEMIGQGLESPAVASAAELKATKYHLEDMRKLVLARVQQTDSGEGVG